MGNDDRDPANVFEAKHPAIIARTLRCADATAAPRDYAQALGSVETVRSLGDDLPTDHKARLESWVRALEHDGQGALEVESTSSGDE